MVDWTGLDWTGLDWTGMEWNGMEWNGQINLVVVGVSDLCRSSAVSRPLRRDHRLFGLFAKSKDLCLQTHLIMISGTDLALSQGPFS